MDILSVWISCRYGQALSGAVGVPVAGNGFPRWGLGRCRRRAAHPVANPSARQAEQTPAPYEPRLPSCWRPQQRSETAAAERAIIVRPPRTPRAAMSETRGRGRGALPWLASPLDLRAHQPSSPCPAQSTTTHICAMCGYVHMYWSCQRQGLVIQICSQLILVADAAAIISTLPASATSSCTSPWLTVCNSALPPPCLAAALAPKPCRA